jgi:hypothetical protein
MNYAPHEQRVLDEANELMGRIQRLEWFFGSVVFKGLPDHERRRLHKQITVMWELHDILCDRISAFPESGA